MQHVDETLRFAVCVEVTQYGAFYCKYLQGDPSKMNLAPITV